MKQIQTNGQFNPSASQPQPTTQNSIAVYRVSLVKDETVSFVQANQYFSFADQGLIKQVYSEIS